MHLRIKPPAANAYVIGLISGAVCGGCVAMALVAGWTNHWPVLLAAIPALIAIPQLSLVYYARCEELPRRTEWWHGTMYLILGTSVCFPLFFLQGYLAQELFDNQISVFLFWLIYALQVGLVGMILLLGYARFRRRP